MKGHALGFIGLVFCLAALGREPLFSLPPQKLLYPGDWAYDALAILSREQKTIFFADMVVTAGQMETFLAEIHPETLSESGKALYAKLDAYLKDSSWLHIESDAMSADIDMRIQPELYFKTNGDVPWIYDYHSRNSLFLLPVSISLGPYITGELDVFVGQNEKAAVQHDNYINIPLKPVSQFDIHFPRRGYLSAGFPLGRASGVQLAIGLGDAFLGRTETGSIILSDYMQRNVYARLSLFSPAIKYTSEVMQYEVNKYHYMHYLQVRPHKTVSFTAAEGVMVNAPLELRFLNPFTIFHSHEAFKTYTDYNKDLGHDPNTNDPWKSGYDMTYDPVDGSRIGSYFGFKVEWQPLRYLRLYGLFAMDQLQLGIEKSNWGDSLTPDAMAFQAGAELSVPVRGGYWILGLEGVYTYPYMYVLWDRHWSFYKEADEVDNMKVRYWTGSPFGPDTIAGVLWSGYRALHWSVTGSFLFSARGERSELSIFDTDTDEEHTYRPTHKVYDVTVPPTGIPVYTCIFSVNGSWSPRDWVTLTLQPGYRLVFNSGHVTGKTEHGFEFVLAAVLKPPLKLRFGREE